MPFLNKNASTSQAAQSKTSGQPKVTKDQISRPSQPLPFGFGHDLSFRLISLEEASKKKQAQNRLPIVNGHRRGTKEPYLGSCWSDSEEDMQRKKLVRRTHKRNNTAPVVPSASSILAPLRHRPAKALSLMTTKALPALPPLSPVDEPRQASPQGSTPTYSPQLPHASVSLDDIFSTSARGQEYLDDIGLRFRESKGHLSPIEIEPAVDDRSLVDKPSLARLLGSRPNRHGLLSRRQHSQVEGLSNSREEVDNTLEIKTIAESELDESEGTASAYTERASRAALIGPQTPVTTVLASLRERRDIVSIDWRSIQEREIRPAEVDLPTDVEPELSLSPIESVDDQNLVENHGTTQGSSDSGVDLGEVVIDGDDDFADAVFRESLVVRRQSQNRTTEEEGRIGVRRRAILVNDTDMSRLETLLGEEDAVVTDEPGTIG
ncbi:hypothetical protein FRC17_001228 [Serendipita sp. 399]|nr:hypothetical protein FRC17_001228 [Serendipita sp. 399]